MADEILRDLQRLTRRVVTRQRGLAAGLVALTLVNMVAQSATIVLLVPLLRVAGVSTASGRVGTIDQVVTALFAAVHLAPTLTTVLAVFIAVAWGQAVLSHMELVGTTRLEQETVRDLRDTLYRALLAARWRFFIEHRGTDITHAVTTDAERAGEAVGYILRAVAQAASVAIYAVFAITISPAASGIALAGGLVLALLLRPTLRAAHRTGEAMTDASIEALALVTRHVDAMKLVKSYGAEDRTARAFDSVADRSAQSAVDATRTHARAHVATIAGSATLLGFALYACVRLLHLDAAAILFLTFLFWRLVPSLMDVQHSIRLSFHELPGYTAVRRLLDAAVAARETPDGAAMPAARKPEIRSTIVFDDVSFAYEREPVLERCSCTIAAGQITAFAGPSGAGKTTIVDLLLGLLTPTAGSIRVDDRVLESGWLPAWRRTVAYVPQDPLLFHDTILTNLQWANPEATMADVWDALTAAAAAEFAKRAPLGLDTIVGDRGMRLSGGERQRLALARALLRKPALLVLDEATSAIDAESEEHILQALRALRGAVTTVLVSHRAAPLACADTVYRIVDGRLERQASGAV